MKQLSNDKVLLRALEPEDVELLYGWENDSDLWQVSNTIAPYSKYVLTQFIESQMQDIYQTRQMRLVIESKLDNRPIGTIDIFDFDPQNCRAGLGLMIYSHKDRRLGYATAAVEVVSRYCFEVLNMHQLYVNISADNQASINLFEKCGFVEIGRKKDWLKAGNKWQDELMMTLIAQ
ncbi:MAG: GNAT family N-acetyltransferase [Rikenellaceae bacterium]|nr:GNAT family N-acetyltransferase [Rikenellaceae bacterium]